LAKDKSYLRSAKHHLPHNTNRKTSHLISFTQIGRVE
jgi:hypothetical protein